MKTDFLGGVIEGFYGRPWTHPQRLALMEQLAQWGLNTYFYAPKDDLKHRALWRQSYDDAQIARMGELVDQCQRNGVQFIYGLSPGLDIRFTDPVELATVQQRLAQMIDIGVQDFALLFDDLPGQMSLQDRQRFHNVASAQISVTNAVYHWLREQLSESRLLFCPTPYCDRMDRRGVGGQDYLDTVGRELHDDIDFFWTGPAIISEQIPVETLDALAARIGRKPVIWDNLHANDYDQRRLFCGPYCRPAELRDSVTGILLNPNNELPINFIPLKTLGMYLNEDDYDPRTAYLKAAAQWSPKFATADSQISTDDIVLLADCHYLPFSDGDQALQLEACIVKLLQQPVDQWGAARSEFEQYHDRVNHSFVKLSQILDRELFYSWSRRIWDLKEELDLISDFAAAKADGTLSDTGFQSETHLPSTCRGGFVAKLQRRLKMNDQGRFEAV